MEPFAPLIGFALAAIIAYVVWQAVDFPYRKQREKELRERLEMQIQANKQLTQNAYPAISGYTGYGFTGYGPSSEFQDPYGLSPKKETDSLKAGLKKLL